MRFSLSTLILAGLFVGCGLSLWLMSHQLQTATSELRSHRNELGHLYVTDDTKINFIAVPQQDEMNWRWRVRLPGGRRYNLCFKTINIASDGFPQPDCTFFLDSGDEFTVALDCHRDERDEWSITASTTRGHSQDLGFLGPTHRSWLEGQLAHFSRVNGKLRTTSADADAPAELLRIRIKDADSSQTDDGVLVWIAEVVDSQQ